MAGAQKSRSGLLLAALIYFSATSSGAYFLNKRHADSAANSPVARGLRELGADIRIKHNDIFYVDLYRCQKSEEAAKLLAQLPALQMLNLSSSNANDDILRQLSGLESLRELAVNNTQITDEGLQHLSGLRNLEVLNLDDNSEVSGRGMQYLSQLFQLRRLHMNHTNVDNEGLAALTKLSKLEHLLLYDTKVDQQAVAELKKSLPKVNVTEPD